MKRIPVTSSQILSIGWEDSIMQVEFNKSLYQYFDVPEAVYEKVLANIFLFNDLIKKGGYQYEKIG